MSSPRTCGNARRFDARPRVRLFLRASYRWEFSNGIAVHMWDRKGPLHTGRACRATRRPIDSPLSREDKTSIGNSVAFCFTTRILRVEH